MEQNKEENIGDKEDRQEKNNPFLSGAIGDILDIPINIVKESLNLPSTNSTAKDTVDDTSVFNNISETIISVKDSIVEHTGDILENTVKVAGEASGNIVDSIGDAISNIDL